VIREDGVRADSPVAQLIVASLRVDADGQAVESARAACGDVDWARFFRSADGHGVTPLIAHRWQSLDRMEHVPDFARERLLSALRHNAERNAHIRREAVDYWRLLTEAGVPAIVLKGWPLVEMLYESPALRHLSDIDLLIPADRSREGLRALEAAGLEPLPRNREAWVEKHLPAYWRLRGRRVTYPLSDLFDPNHPRSVELHLHVWETNFRGLRLRDPIGFWERSRLADVAGWPMRLPSLEDTLIHLCVHWACHWIEREARLSQLVDVDRFVRKFAGRLDWNLILRVSRAAQVTRFVYAALETAHRVLGAPLPPEEFTAQSRAGCPPRLRHWMDRYAAEDALAMDSGRRDHGMAYVLTWLSAQSVGERVGMLRYALLPPREFIMGRYGLKRRWLAIPFYLPYIAGRTLNTMGPFARAVTRFARLGSQA